MKIINTTIRGIVRQIMQKMTKVVKQRGYHKFYRTVLFFGELCCLQCMLKLCYFFTAVFGMASFFEEGKYFTYT